MKTLLACLALSTLIAGAAAQAPVFEPMPEGSHDAYVGLGLSHRPSYAGSGLRRWQLEPTLQVAWSSGLFISGTQAGWHLGDAASSRWPRLEWGPLISLQAPRDEDGQGWFLDSPGTVGNLGGLGTGAGVAGTPGRGRLQGLDPISARLEWGGFVALRLSPRWRLTQGLLAGGGRDGDGLQWRADLHHALPALAEHHSLSWSVGVAWGNAAYNRSFFGVTGAQALRSGHVVHRPGAGLNDLHTQLRWNWALHPHWVLSTTVQASRVLGQAARSPLVERAAGVGASTSLVYRF